jgi:hypothetical protein
MNSSPFTFIANVHFYSSLDQFEIHNWILCCTATIYALACILGNLVRRKNLPEGDPEVSFDELEPLELALIAHGGDRMRFAVTGIASLMTPVVEQPTDNPSDLAAPLPIPSEVSANSPPLLADLHRRLLALGSAPPSDTLLAALEMADKEGTAQMRQRGLVVSRWWTTPAPWKILLPIVVAWLLLWATFNLGGLTERIRLVDTLGIATLIVGTFTIAKNPYWVRHRETILQDAATRLSKLSSGVTPGAPSRSPALLALAVAMLGTAALDKSEHASLLAAVSAYENPGGGNGGCGGGDGGGDGGSGGGCGGDGGGGGCGGCGGCGCGGE